MGIGVAMFAALIGVVRVVDLLLLVHCFPSRPLHSGIATERHVQLQGSIKLAKFSLRIHVGHPHIAACTALAPRRMGNTDAR
jgi:hypothetical protein